jgi:hypothetical protein
MIWIFCEPVSLAVRADRLFANFAFKRVLEDIVANAADQFGQEGSYVRFVIDVVLLIDIARDLFSSADRSYAAARARVK